MNTINDTCGAGVTTGSEVCKQHDATDNKYEDCPPRMSDGRQFTDYRPRCEAVFGGLPQPMSSYEYRMFLTSHAEDIINKNRDIATLRSSCDWCDSRERTAPPFRTSQRCDDRVCTFEKVCGRGIGVDNATTAGLEASPWDGTAFAACAAAVSS